MSSVDGIEVASALGKFRRTVHVAYDLALTDPESIDMELTPATADDSLTLLTFVDQSDGEMHVYVLNEDYRQRLVKALTGGVILGGTIVDFPPRNGS